MVHAMSCFDLPEKKGSVPTPILLGLDGPGSHGLAVCQHARMRSSIPIIVLSSTGREDGKVRAFDLGADDYVCTPFGVEELLARVRVAFRDAARLPSAAGSLLGEGRGVYGRTITQNSRFLLLEDRHDLVFSDVKLSRRVTPPTRLQNRTCAF